VARLGADITAFTVGTHGDPLDEAGDARQTARTLGIRHEVIDLSPEETPDLDEMVSAYGEPFACASALGMLRVSRAVKQSATVLLTGDGGDDVFLGYPEHKHFWMAERLARKVPSGGGRCGGTFGMAAAKWDLAPRNSFPRLRHRGGWERSPVPIPA
jgi:asparagine synthase (glutamine-hydrolysing)